VPEVAVLPNISGHAPAITLMPCCSQNAAASGDTLVPARIIDWCIQTRRTPASGHWRTMAMVISELVTMTTPSTPPGTAARFG
jgi:hypothetical protein